MAINNFLSGVLLFAVFCLGGCTDAERAKFGSLGSPHSVECFSGGTLIYKGTATGKVLSEDSSDGYYFTEKESGKLMEVSGNCVITRL